MSPNVDIQNAFSIECEWDNYDGLIKKTPLLLVWDDARIATQKRIGNLNNLHKHYITGKIFKA